MRRILVGDFRIGEEEKRAVNEVLDSGRISENVKVKAFEKAWADYIGTKYCVLVNSGTSALIAGLTALKYHLGIKDESKVITSPLTYIADANAIVAAKLQPAFVDIDPKTFSIQPESLEALLSNSASGEYSVILPVHLMGYPCDMDAINSIGKKYNLAIFEDSAQAHGSPYNGKKVGSLSDLSAYSFYIAHNIQAGELGAITTDNPELYRLIKKIKANGRACDCEVCMRSKGQCKKLSGQSADADIDPRFSHEIIGFNFKAMEFQAALAISQVAKADEIIRKRQENVSFLNMHLAQFSQHLQLPLHSPNISYLAYPLVVREGSRFNRRRIRDALEKNGIETRQLFGCIPTQQPAYAHLKDAYKSMLPHAEYAGNNGFYVGCHQYLVQEDLEYMVSIFKEIFGAQ